MKPKTTSIMLAIALAAVLSLIAAQTCIAATTWTRNRPVTYYVNENATGANNGTSWQDAFTGLQSALSVAVAGDNIWVAAGTYKPSLSIDPQSSDPRLAAFSLIGGVDIYGGFQGNEHNLNQRHLDDTTVTVLSGDIGIVDNDSDNSYHVVYANGVSDAVLDGFAVTGGRAVMVGGVGYIMHRNGGGMYNNNSKLTVSNCIFSENKALSDGGGMYNNESALAISNCIFSDNRAGDFYSYSPGKGGGMYNRGFYNFESSSIVTGCTFNDNVAEPWTGGILPKGGGGMYNEESSPTVDRCTFARNWTRSSGYGGGMLNFGGAPTVTNSIFSANWAGLGGGMSNLGTSGATILNCTFYKNGWKPSPNNPDNLIVEAGQGGAIYELHGGASRIVDVIFSGNAARRDNSGNAHGGALYAREDRALTLNHCFFYENVRWDSDGSVSDHIYVQSFPPAETSDLLYDVNPLLADPENGDFHLLQGSPCIDAGITRRDACFANHCWLPLPATDFEGDKRIIDGDGFSGKAADIGADEYVPTLPDLRDFVQGLADAGQIDATLAERFLAYIDAAQAALQQSQPTAATNILQSLIADVKASLGNTQTALAIEARVEAVIENLD